MAKLTLEDGMRLMQQAMESAADEAKAVFVERPTVVRDGNRLYMLWADGEITNEVEAELLQ